jgi:transcriptional regulator with XRE-family HTH domain
MSRGAVLPVEKLERARVLRGWSKSDLAEKSGLGIATVSRALAGRPVEMETVRRLGLAFTNHPPLPEVLALLSKEEMAW